MSKLQVFHSNTGYYIGQEDVDGLPLSKESGYFPTYSSAEAVLINRLQTRDCDKNKKLLPEIHK